MDVAKQKEWKVQKLAQDTFDAGMEYKRTEAPPILTSRGILPTTEPQPAVQLAVPVASEGKDDLKKDMREIVDMMNTLSLNLMNSNRGGGQG